MVGDQITEMSPRHEKLIDLSHTVEHGLLTYKGLPPPVISDFRGRAASREFYAPGTEFHIAKIEMVGNTGTYLDAPFHRFPQGKDLSELPLASLAALSGIRIVANANLAIDEHAFRGIDVAGKAVLVNTHWSDHWLTEKYFERCPFLTRKAAELLKENGAALVGIDSTNIDDINDKSRPAHTVLLEANIPIVEHLTNLEALPDHGFQFFSVPVKVKSFSSFPVRAFAIVAA